MRKCRGCKERLPKLADSSSIERAGFCSFECKNYKPVKKLKAKPIRKRKTTAQRANDLAVLLQKLVRLKASDAMGCCTCVTCGARKHWKEMQGGHFIERGKAATKCMEENIHPQCPYCNRYGMKIASVVLEYRRWMENMYGRIFVDDLIRKSKGIHKHNREEIELEIQQVKEQINLLQ